MTGVRLVIAECSVDYSGRLSAHLPKARRLLLVKADGSVLVHSDGGSYKPLNWMSPPAVTTAALTSRETWCGIIVDGIHVHPAVLKPPVDGIGAVHELAAHPLHVAEPGAVGELRHHPSGNQPERGIGRSF